MRMTVSRFLYLVVLCGVTLGGCSVGPLASRVPASAPPASALPMSAEPQTKPTPSEQPSARPAENNDIAAEDACSSILHSIPIVIVRSGKPTVAGAFDVTGEQLTKYFVSTFDANAEQSNGSDWWNDPTERVVMCLYDGDFGTTTPGPEGHNTSATRVLVVISQGKPEFWASTLDKATIPAVDPATMGV
jgi:hypothetical protein